MHLSMKIVFVCGAMEEGRDGVGDYSRRLAVELLKNGHQVGIVAVNDQHIKTELNGVQQSGGQSVPVLRLPSQWTAQQRFRRAKAWIDDLDPEWVSLQFVPFAFHPKGLTFGINKWLILGKKRRWHIMVHELWVGMDEEAGLKFKYWGWLQRQLIKRLFAKLNPDIVHTQCDLYIKMLAKVHVTPIYLPLFGNIPVAHQPQILVYPSQEDTRDIITFVVFGGIHPGSPVAELAHDLKVYSSTTSTQIELKMVGRCGSEQQRWTEVWTAAGISMELLGEQSPEFISAVFTNATIGISTTPAALIEKSGSVAAMREHGLPILCISRPWHPSGIKEINLPDGVVEYQPGKMQEFLNNPKKPATANNISSIANQFIDNLLSA